MRIEAICLAWPRLMKTIIGGAAKHKRGRGVTDAKHKTLVIGAVEGLS